MITLFVLWGSLPTQFHVCKSAQLGGLAARCEHDIRDDSPAMFLGQCNLLLPEFDGMVQEGYVVV